MRAPMHFCAMISLVLVQIGCGSADSVFREKVEQYGYIAYETPLEYAGTGTLVGGKPGALKLVAAPDTCFPHSESESDYYDMRKLDKTTLSSESYELEFGGRISLDVLSDMLGKGGPGVQFKVEGNIAKKVDLKMDNVEIEYLDLIRLSEFYNDEMRTVCKDFLNNFGFIVQALRVGKMSLTFYHSHGGAIDLSVTGIEGIVDIGAGINWEIVNRSELMIHTPKYVGYQIGRLLDADNGKALYRASRVKKGSFEFENIALFDVNDHDFALESLSTDFDIDEKALRFYDAESTDAYSRFK